MSGVNIPPYTKEIDGVQWTASWDAEGKILYKGVKNGEEVNSVPPSDMIKDAHEHGAGFGNNENKQPEEEKKEEKSAENFKDTCDGLVIETNKDGTLKSANIPEANWTPKQREFVDNCLKAAAMGDQSNSKNENKAVDKERSFKETVKAEFKEMIARGSVEIGEMLKYPVRAAKDLYKAGKLIAQGKFRELRDRAALRVHDNLEALGLLSDNMQERINAANKRIEERLGIEDREKNPNIFSKVIGRGMKKDKADIMRLSGRTGTQSVKSVVNPSGRDNRVVSR